MENIPYPNIAHIQFSSPSHKPTHILISAQVYISYFKTSARIILRIIFLLYLPDKTFNLLKSSLLNPALFKRSSAACCVRFTQLNISGTPFRYVFLSSKRGISNDTGVVERWLALVRHIFFSCLARFYLS